MILTRFDDDRNRKNIEIRFTRNALAVVNLGAFANHRRAFIAKPARVGPLPDRKSAIGNPQSVQRLINHLVKYHLGAGATSTRTSSPGLTPAATRSSSPRSRNRFPQR